MPGVSARPARAACSAWRSPRTTPQTRWVYAYYTAGDDNRIVRFKLGSDGTPEVIFDGIAKAGIHNGGRIAFGPDGMLYVGTGDAGERSRVAGPGRAPTARSCG